MNAQQLKNSILQYAMQGKLVPQDPNDEPVAELVERIRKEKEKLIQNKVIKKDKLLPPISNEEIPFDIPENWEWLRLGEIGRWNAGATPLRSRTDYYNGNIPWLKTGDLNDGFIDTVSESITELALKETSVKLMPKGSVLMAMYGATIGKLGILNIEATTNQACCACIPYDGINNRYLFYYLNQQRKNFIEQGAGGAQPNISKEKIVRHLIPIPPLNEQSKIVEKIEELLEKNTLFDLSQKDLNDLRSRFPMKLENSILHYAMQGKLVEQDPDDEIAANLVKRIREEKERLIEGKIIKKEKALPPISDEEIPFDIPDSWEWVRLNDICNYIQRGKSPKYSDIKEIPVFSQKCVQWSGFDSRPARFIDPLTFEKYEDIRKLQDKDILWNSTGLGTVGRVAIYKDKLNPYPNGVVDSHVTIVRCSSLVITDFIYFYLSSFYIQSRILDLTSGTTKQRELNTSTVKTILIPLPPAKEQERIICEINRLLKVTKKLKD